jgi:hypothetical protein
MDGRKHILRANLQRGVKIRRARVGADEFRVPVRLLQAQRRDGATAQAIETQRAGAGEQFQHPRADHPRAQAVEDRLFDEVGRGPDVESPGNLEDPPRCMATGDAHDLIWDGDTPSLPKNYLKISLKNNFMYSHERRSAFSL